MNLRSQEGQNIIKGAVPMTTEVGADDRGVLRVRHGFPSQYKGSVTYFRTNPAITFRLAGNCKLTLSPSIFSRANLPRGYLKSVTFIAIRNGVSAKTWRIKDGSLLSWLAAALTPEAASDIFAELNAGHRVHLPGEYTRSQLIDIGFPVLLEVPGLHLAMRPSIA
jgi:hypothetical protein